MLVKTHTFTGIYLNSITISSIITTLVITVCAGLPPFEGTKITEIFEELYVPNFESICSKLVALLIKNVMNKAMILSKLYPMALFHFSEECMVLH